MSRYADKTTVSSEKSRAEIERTLTRYGAEKFMYGWDADQAILAFCANGRNIKFTLPLPPKEEFGETPTGRERSAESIQKAWEQACRQRWRAMALVIKAKLEAVECGVTSFEDEFLAHIALPNGDTFGQWARPQIAKVYTSGKMPPLLPAGRS